MVLPVEEDLPLRFGCQLRVERVMFLPLGRREVDLAGLQAGVPGVLFGGGVWGLLGLGLCSGGEGSFLAEHGIKKIRAGTRGSHFSICRYQSIQLTMTYSMA